MEHGISGRVTDENTPRETADAQGRREETKQKPHRHIGSLAIFEARTLEERDRCFFWRSGKR